jgi:hypothetical protein
MRTNSSVWHSSKDASAISHLYSGDFSQIFGMPFAPQATVGQTNPMRNSQGGSSDLAATERRREQRLSADIPAEITGIDHAGHLFTERTLLEDVSEIGYRFETHTQLQCGDIVAVKPVEPGEKSLMLGQSQLVEVAWIAHHKAGWTVGTRKLHGEKLAKPEFPPASYSPRLPAK